GELYEFNKTGIPRRTPDSSRKIAEVRKFALYSCRLWVVDSHDAPELQNGKVSTTRSALHFGQRSINVGDAVYVAFGLSTQLRLSVSIRQGHILRLHRHCTDRHCDKRRCNCAC